MQLSLGTQTCSTRPSLSIPSAFCGASTGRYMPSNFQVCALICFLYVFRSHGPPFLPFLPLSRSPCLSCSRTGRLFVSINSQRLAVEVFDEKRFHKKISGGLQELRTLVGDALFTAYHGESNWGIARTHSFPPFHHRVHCRAR